MNKFRKNYFDYLFSLFVTGITLLSLTGQIVFLSIGLTVGIADWGTDGVLIFGFGGLSLPVLLGALLTVFAGWRYWHYDNEGIANGGLLWERKFSYKEIESIDVKEVAISALPFIVWQEEMCFYKGKKNVMIPTCYLSEEETKWLREQVETE